MEDKTIELKEINKLCDYEDLFRNNDRPKTKRKKSSNSFLFNILKINFLKIFFSSIFYIIKAIPIWGLPIITANIINIVSEPKNDNTVKYIAINSIILVIMIIQNIPMHMAHAKIADKMLRDTSAGLKSTVVRKLQSLSITYHNEIETGKIQAKFLKDADSIESLLGTIVRVIIPNFFNIIISCVIAFYKSGLVSFFFMLVIPINVLFSILFNKRIKRSFSDYRKETENMSSKLSNMLEMLTITKAHGLEQNELYIIKHNILKVKKSGLKIDKEIAIWGSVAWCMNMLLNSTCLVFCAFLAINNKIGIGDIVLYQTLFSSISSYVLILVNSIPQLGIGMDAIDSVTEIMQSKDVEMSLGRIHPKSIEGNVTFSHVYYHYPNKDEFVINDFNLNVVKGECIAVVGSSGSGKSTIMNMIIGFLNPVKGELYIDGVPLRNYDLTQYRHNISVVPQNCILFKGTIRENITYGLTNYGEEELKEAIRKANLEEFISELPNGIDTEIGEHGGTLSGGQKQRITIARALIRNPQILIFDEATSALDNLSEFNVQKAISSCIKGRTTFIVAHRLSTIRDANRIIVMEKGRIVEQGTYDSLIAKKGKFYELKNLNEINNSFSK